MSQAGFGDSSSQDSSSDTVHEPQYQSPRDSSSISGESSLPLTNLPRTVLEQELQFCNERSQQAQILLRQAQEQLQLSQLVIQRQESLTQTLQSRIDQLERELEDAHAGCDELRDRLKRQQHHTSQLKAALERCLDTSHTTSFAGGMAANALESWSISKLADEKITPIEATGDHPLQNVVKIAPSPQPLESSELTSTNVTAINNITDASIEPQAIAESDYLAIPQKSQPISPLIVRPHKASQGSPIAPNLPKLQITEEAEANRTDNFADSSREDRHLHITNADHSDHSESVILAADLPSQDAARSSLQVSSPVLNNSGVVSTVTTPKFIQALYGNPHNNSQNNYQSSSPSSSSVISDQEEPMELEQVANTSNPARRVVTSLAAVQLPQFPPLPRR